MIGFQCSPAVQPVYGRSGLYSSPGHQVVAPAPQNAFHRPPILPPNILDYWPGLGNDGLHVSWAHAVNSRSKLNDALIGESFCTKVFPFEKCTCLFVVVVVTPVSQSPHSHRCSPVTGKRESVRSLLFAVAGDTYRK